ncbi:MAG: hypothetical protein ABSF99_01070 [Anaerolineales bacterium]|jgi:hypothetical protein
MSPCECDTLVHPASLVIPAGLDWIPRQIAGFPEFRRAMLASIPLHPALAGWQGRDENDLGVMLLEMWAYVADVLAFYDQVIANEAYLRTARRRPALRKLTDLLGYLPKPAVAATVELACLADGRQAVSLPAGTAFRSVAFESQNESQKPQVFELETDITIHPFNNQWILLSRGALPADFFLEATLDVLPAMKLEKDVPLLIRAIYYGSPPGLIDVRCITGVTQKKASDGTPYQQISLSSGTLQHSPLSSSYVATLQAPTRTAHLYTADTSTPAIKAVSIVTSLILDGLYPQIKSGDYILLQKGTDFRWFMVSQVDTTSLQASPSPKVTIDSNTNDTSTSTTFTISGVSTPPLTCLQLDVDLNKPSRRGSQPTWSDSDRAMITLHFGMVTAGQVYAPPGTTLMATDELQVKGQPEIPPQTCQPKHFLLEDKNQNGTAVDGVLDFTSGELTLDAGTSWSPAMTLPVKLYGNIIKASRGETVSSEILGSGDGSRANQSFKLKKSPLTYLSAPGSNDQGVVSTLRVYVDGLEWQEVASFYGTRPTDQVYVLRQDDQGVTSVIFGDGQRGSRLPSGTNNIVATYRYGAGKAVPPVGGINQLARPVKGLIGVRSPVKGAGGEDAESAEKMRLYGPRSALLLGRVVSLDDILVVACGVSGVRAAQVEWSWNGERQQPVAQVWYIGDASLKKDILTHIHAVSEPNLPVDASAAQSVPLQLSLDLEVDQRRLKEKVLEAVRSALLDPESGLLPPERIGIGQPLVRSQLFTAVLAVEGVRSVTGIRAVYADLDIQWSEFAIQPGAGCYFDIEQGSLTLNGKEG